mgnify:CR=1 FL=1
MQTAFVIRVSGKFIYLPFDEVLYIKAKGNYCEFITTRQKKYVSYGTIGAIEPQLPENLFCRIHKSHVISIRKIKEFDHSSIQIGDTELPLSKIGFEKLLERLLIIDPEYGTKSEEIKKMSVDEYLKKYRKPGKGNNVNPDF